MLAFEGLAVSFGSTGAQTIFLNNSSLTPKAIIWFTGGKYNTNENTNARGGVGMTDVVNGYQASTAHLKNSTGPFVRNYPSTESFAILDGSSGNPNVRGHVTGVAAGEIDVTIDNADINFQVFGLVIGDDGL